MNNNLMLLHKETMSILRTAQRLPDIANLFHQQAFGACMMFIELFPDVEEIVCEYWNSCLDDAFRRIEKRY